MTASGDQDDDAIGRALLGWYGRHARVLPWRALPGTPPPEPYRVWLSEVMLQQTTVAAVGPYFAKFLTRWPTVNDLAAAPDEEVMAAWAGLGYYARARNLLACARVVAARGGVFPDTEPALRELPGLGAYTAAAVAAIAFRRRAVVVDANVERVVARLFAIRTPLPGGRAEIRNAAERITPDECAGDFAQAMMDLGATICTTRSPRCLLCPLNAGCAANRLGTPTDFPVKAARPARPVRQGRAFWIARRNPEGTHVWLVQRPGKGMLGGMRALPDDGWSARGDGAAAPPLELPWRTAGQVIHGFTHFTLELAVLAGEANPTGDPPGDGVWWPVEKLDAAGLPTLFAKAAHRAITSPYPT